MCVRVIVRQRFYNDCYYDVKIIGCIQYKQNLSREKRSDPLENSTIIHCIRALSTTPIHSVIFYEENRRGINRRVF